MIVAGIDLSLANTGLAVIHDDPTPLVRRVRSKGTADDTLQQRYKRLVDIGNFITGWVGFPDLVVIEAPAFSRTTGHQHDRSGLWWLLVESLITKGVPVAEVPPTSRAMYATGAGNGGKGNVIEAVTRRYPHVDTGGDDNLCDALVLAAMGARHLGHPIEHTLPQTHLRAMDKIKWPAAVST